MQPGKSICLNRRPQVRDWEISNSIHPTLIKDFDAKINLKNIKSFTLTDGSINQSNISIQGMTHYLTNQIVQYIDQSEHCNMSTKKIK